MTTVLATVLPSPRPDTEALGHQITELCGYIYAATYRLLVLIRKFDEQDGWHQHGLCSCAHWLNFKCGIGLNAAREKVRVARALKDLPKISAAFEQGRLSFSKVRAMTRIADASNEDYLLGIAEHGSAQHVEGLVSRYRRCRRLQDVEIANQQQQNRRFSYYFDVDGCLVFNGRLPAEQGALVVKALEMAVEKAFGEASGQSEAESEPDPESWPEFEPEPTLDTESGAELESESESDAEAEPEHRSEPIAARRADALATIAETYMNTGPVANATADRYQVVVHVSRDTLRDVTAVMPDEPGIERARLESGSHVTAETSDETGVEHAHLENGPNVTAETSRRVACDCSMIKVVENDLGEPLSIGRKSRSIPPAIRRALGLRDGGCRFPGCTHTCFVDGHHIEHWADGGETRLDNLILLCRYHHRLVHEGGYGCERTADGQVVFTAPDRSVLPHSWPLHGIAAGRDPQQWFQCEIADLEIDPETCSPAWHAGDEMDWHMAVSALFETSSSPH